VIRKKVDGEQAPTDKKAGATQDKAKAKPAKKTTAKATGGMQLANPAVLARQMYMDAILVEHANKRKTSLMYRPRSKPMKLGLSMPLPLEFLLDTEVLPLGVMLEANGPPMSCKSMLMYEFGRIASAANGWMESVLTEGKASETAARSVIGWDDVGQNSFLMKKANDLNHAMQLMRESLDNIKRVQETINPQTGKPYGDVFPVIVAVDSIMGALSRETMDKITKKGEAGRSFPVEALQLTQFIKYLASCIQNEPWLFFLINHRKERPKDPSQPHAPVEFSKPGGKQIQFSDSYELVLHMTRSWIEVDQDDTGGVEVQYRRIRMDNGKNSAGTDNRHILVDVCWRAVRNPDDPKGGMLQQTMWDWDSATVDLLMDWKDIKKHRLLSKAADAYSPERKMDKFFHLRRVTGDRYWSKNFGMNAAGAVDKRTMGRMIQEDDTVRSAIRRAFNIAEGKAWVGGTSYSSEMRRVLKEAQKEADLYLEAAKRRLELNGGVNLKLDPTERYKDDQQDDSYDSTTAEYDDVIDVEMTVIDDMADDSLEDDGS
jgi:hypothetical protein